MSIYQTILSIGLVCAVSGFSQSQWTLVDKTPTNNSQEAVIFVNDKFVTAGDGGTVMESTNGKDWTLHSVGGDFYLTSIAYGNGTYVAVGRGCIYRSEDLISWTKDAQLTDHYSAILYAKNQFVLLGGKGALYTSPDGITWTLRSTPTESNLTCVRYLNGLYIVGGWYGTILTSTDGITWNERHGKEAYAFILYDIAYGLNQYIAVGGSGSTFTSTDAITWKKVLTSATEVLTSILFTQDSFTIVGQWCVNFTSPDGSTWTRHSNTYGAYYMAGLAYGNGIYVASGTKTFYSGTSSPSRIPSPNALSLKLPQAIFSFDLNGRLVSKP